MEMLQNWIINNFEYGYNFTIDEIFVVICCVNNKGPNTEMFNYSINISELYINKKHSLNKPLYQLNCFK